MIYLKVVTRLVAHVLRTHAPACRGRYCDPRMSQDHA